MIATKRRIEKSTGILNATPSYDTATEFTDGAYHTFVTAHCIECGEAGVLHWNTGGNHPDFVARKYRGMGWHFDAYKPKKCVCPACVAGRKPAPHMADAGGLFKDSHYENVTQEEPDDMAKSNSYTPPVTDTAVLRAAVAHMEADDYNRTLTSHEKAKVRGVLDSHFDDQIGRYIDNYDDQRVGKETNLPWALVAEYRELAYGPLKADPIVEAVKAEAVVLRQEFTELSHAMDALRDRIVKVEGRLVNVEAKAKKL